jgi:hypothetical protein
MKNPYPPLFSTGICDTSHSKRTLVSLMKGLRTYIPSPVLAIQGEKVHTARFTDIQTERGCVYLSGVTVPGQSLYQMYVDFKAESFRSVETLSFLGMAMSLLDASLTFSQSSGSFPLLLMNSIFIADDGRLITFLPYELMDYLNTFLDDEKRQVLYYPIMVNRNSTLRENRKNSDERWGLATNEDEFTQNLARLMYLFFTKYSRSLEAGKEQSVYNDRVYYLGTEMRGVPREVADTLWNQMHGKPVNVEDMRAVLAAGVKQQTPRAPVEKIPIVRRRRVISMKAGITDFFSRRWKLLLIILILLGVALYLLSDALLSRTRQDFTAGLTPMQVVELYYESVNNLDLNYLDAIYYKRSGKKVKDELSTVYVMLKMETAFGKIIVHPDEIAGSIFDHQLHSVFGIRDLELTRMRNGEDPVYRATYTRVVSSGETLHETVMEETIQLQFIDDHWYITKSERSILSEAQDTRQK